MEQVVMKLPSFSRVLEEPVEHLVQLPVLLGAAAELKAHIKVAMVDTEVMHLEIHHLMAYDMALEVVEEHSLGQMVTLLTNLLVVIPVED